MSKHVFQVILIGAVLGCCSAALVERNCTETRDGRSLSCYTCMGRDMDNCMTGLTCCKGSCFKLIDTHHDLIVKGCVENGEEDASMKVRELGISLYWANDERVKGESYFCNGKSYCNVAPSVTMSAFSSVTALFIFKLFV